MWGTGLDTRADADGRFALQNLPVGSFALEARAVGCDPLRQTVTLVPDSAARPELVFARNVFPTLRRPCPRVLAYDAGCDYSPCMQYTIRNISPALDQALRRRAREQGASLNEVALEALARGAGVADEVVRQRTLGDLAGRWQEDVIFDDALREHEVIDHDLWQ